MCKGRGIDPRVVFTFIAAVFFLVFSVSRIPAAPLESRAYQIQDAGLSRSFEVATNVVTAEGASVSLYL